MSLNELLVDPFQAEYMRRALVEVLLLGVLAGAVGVAVVLRRLAFYGDVLTHTVFPGIVLAVVLHQSVFLGALVFALATAVLLAGLGRGRRVPVDAGLAILLTSFFSLGVVLVSRRESYTSDLTLFLFGRLLTVDRAELVLTALVGAAVLGVLALVGKELLLRAFDPDGAEAMGYRTVLLDLLLNVCVALVVVAALKAVGTLLVLALIVIPAAAARLVTDRVGSMVAVSCVLGALAGWVGLAASYRVSIDYGVRLGSAATVVLVLVACFALCVAAGPGLRRLRLAMARRSGQ
jgi:manganese/iron transport system permease protein